jgi:hypothetical protein
VKNDFFFPELINRYAVRVPESFEKVLAPSALAKKPISPA